MKKRTILERYYEWAEAGYIDNVSSFEQGPNKIEGNGLCYSTIVEDYYDLFLLVMPEEGSTKGGYWGFHEDETATDNEYCDSVFNPLRQNLVLLMACLNNEL